jgi:AcrR family transcriptional regulator
VTARCEHQDQSRQRTRVTSVVVREKPGQARDGRGREKILNAALEVFAERGYDAASIAEIGQRAGFAKSVMYHHFGSKAGLYEAIMVDQTAQLVERVSQALPEDPAKPRLRVGIDAYFAFIHERPLVWRLLFRDPPTDPELLAVHRRAQQRRAELLAGLLGPDANESAAQRKAKHMHTELLATGVRAFASWWHDHPKVPRETVVDAVMAFSDVGLQAVTTPTGKRAR